MNLMVKKIMAFPMGKSLVLWANRRFARYNTVFGFNPAPDWIGYLLQNNMPDKVLALKRGLDVRSLALVDSVFQRLTLLPITNGYLGFTKMNSRYLLSLRTAEETALFHEWQWYIRHRCCEFALDEKTRKADTFVCHSGLWNKSKKLKQYVAGKDFVDGGAYIGDTALVYLKHYSPSKVWSFEISEQARKRFAANMKKNGVDGGCFSLIPMGLSDKVRDIAFADTGTPGNSIYSEGESKTQLTDLDLFAEAKRLSVGFIKTDVEGAGVDALKGMERTIKRDRPVLSLAIYHSPKEFFETKPLLDSIVEKLDYTVTIEKHWPFAGEMLEIVLFAYPRELAQ